MNFTERYTRRRIPRRTFLWGLGGAALLAACGGSRESGSGANLIDPTSTTSLSPEASATAEATQTSEGGLRESEKAKINLGNWEVSVVDWQLHENLLDYFSSNDSQDPNFNMVSVQLIAKNTSSGLVDSAILGRLSSFYSFRFVDREGNFLNVEDAVDVLPYINYGGIYTTPYLEHDSGAVYVMTQDVKLDGYKIPPGFSFPIGLASHIEKNKEIFGLVVQPRQEAIPNPHNVIGLGEQGQVDLSKVVEFGEISRPPGTIPPESQLTNKRVPKIFDQESGRKFEISFEGFSEPIFTNPGEMKQFLYLNIHHISDFLFPEDPERSRRVQAIPARAGEYFADFQVQIYLNDGRVISARGTDETELLSIGESEIVQIPISSTRRQGDRQRVRHPGVNFEDDDNYFGLIYNLEDAVVVVTDGEDWVAWQNDNLV